MEERPPETYAGIIAVYLSLLGALAALVRRKKALSKAPPAQELAMLGLATFRFSRLLAYDRVTQVLRLPFVRVGEGYEQLEGTQEEPKGSGLQRSLGQLLNCSWCASVWAGTFNVGIYALFPPIGRLWNLVLMASGIAELLDPLFPLFNFLAGYIEEKEDVLQQ